MGSWNLGLSLLRVCRSVPGQASLAPVTTGLLIDLLHAGCMESSRDTWGAMAVCLMHRRDSGCRWKGLQWGPSWGQTQSPQQLPGHCPLCQGPAGVPGAHVADCERGKGGEAGALTPEAALCAELSFLSVKTPTAPRPSLDAVRDAENPGKAVSSRLCLIQQGLFLSPSNLGPRPPRGFVGNFLPILS